MAKAKKAPKKAVAKTAKKPAKPAKLAAKPAPKVTSKPAKAAKTTGDSGCEWAWIEAGKGYALSLETWKLPMYGTRTTDGTATPTMMRYVALAPFHLLFERAWKRIESGDVPKYDEVKR